MVKLSKSQLKVVSHNSFGQVAHTCAFVSKQHNLLLSKGLDSETLQRRR